MSTPIKQHLAIFLDGTWNTEDDSTNVLNAYHNTIEGLVEGKDEKGNPISIMQKRYYDRGVGTSVSDNVRGGGYGMGLEKNVREAYNWLVDNYNDKDKIFIFGFSRGAYTARSLAGLIAACGLVRRGAPITVTQLWNGYAFISSNREHNKDYKWWEETLDIEKNKQNNEYFGRITDLYSRSEKEPLINKSEELVRNWSIRVPISYLGIYDTVGAMGVQALGIPGLKSKLDQNHNLSPSGLFMKCRHALAIDEHRSSFRLTPILDFVHNIPKPKETIDFYKDRIHQMWFAGVHSNIGGGYANNVLSTAPYNWIMEGAQKAGLTVFPRHAKIKDIQAHEPKRTDIRDSFAELAGAIYPHIIRAKRNFRPIDRDDLVRSGNTLRPINEEIHPSVFAFAKENKSYAPPNVLAYLREHPEKDTDNTFSNREPQHQWPGEIINYGPVNKSIKNYLQPRILLILWSIIAALGLLNVAQFFWVESFTPPVYVLAVIAGIFVLVDWGEFKVTLATNFFPKAVRLKVIWNVLYWIRLLGILTFAIGIICFICTTLSWDSEFNFTIKGLWAYLKAVFSKVWLSQYLIAFGGTAILILLLDSVGGKFKITVAEESLKIDPSHLKLHSLEQKTNKWAMVIALLTLLSITSFAIYKLWHQIPNIEDKQHLSGSHLLILLLLLSLIPMADWVGKPMGKFKANLGSIVKLQTAFSNSQISAILNSWLNELYRTWHSEKDKKVLAKLDLGDSIKNETDKNKVLAWIRLRELTRTALWRDIIGFVPLYSFVLGTILWIGSSIFCNNAADIECYQLFGKIPLWLCLILFIAIFDMLENWIHLLHIKNHPIGGSSTFLVLLGALCTILKFAGFISAVVLSFIIVFFKSKIILSEVGDWKWLVATGLTYFLLLTFIPIAYSYGKKILFTKM